MFVRQYRHDIRLRLPSLLASTQFAETFLDVVHNAQTTVCVRVADVDVTGGACWLAEVVEVTALAVGRLCHRQRPDDIGYSLPAVVEPTDMWYGWTT
jgi:hypothetical protein